jgi:hypothetical protein
MLVKNTNNGGNGADDDLVLSGLLVENTNKGLNLENTWEFSSGVLYF